jgi:hypothetical protein
MSATKITVPSLHKKKLDEISSREAQLPDLRNRLASLQAEHLACIESEHKDAMALCRRKALDTEIPELERRINEISSERMEYFLQSGDALFNFMAYEQSKDVKGVKKFELGKNGGVGLGKDIKQDQPNQQYYRKYRSRVDPCYVYAPESNLNDDNFCYKCQKFRVLHQDESIMVCETCYSQTTLANNPERPSIKDPPAESRSFYEYKRFTHFCDWLANLQGKESHIVPDEVIDAVIREIRRKKMDDRLDELTEEDIKGFLKKYKGQGYDRYYDHATQILFRITDIPPIQMTPEMEHNLQLMFVQIQEPFELYKNGRTNFSSYAYIIYKCCQLLGYTEFLPKLRLHKNLAKVYEHDMIWKRICQHLGGEEMGWKFIKSYEY